MARLNMLLIHDWDYKKYTKMTSEIDAWFNYSNFTKELSSNFNIYKINLPGFCGRQEPKEQEWYLENYADYIEKYLTSNMINIDLVLSVGLTSGTVIKWKTKYKRKTKIILVSPIIYPKEVTKTNVVLPGFLKGFANKIRNTMITKLAEIPEMTNGTPYLQNTYQILIKTDLFTELLKVPANDLCMICGQNDTDTDPMKLYNNLPIDYKGKLAIISNTGSIIDNHSHEIINIIVQFFSIK